MTLEEFSRLRQLRTEIATVLRKVDDVLREQDGPCDRTPSIDAIKRAVASYYRVTLNDLESARRPADLAYARHMAMYLCKQLTPKSYPAIGRLFGKRDHTTVMHGVRHIERLMLTDNDVAHDAGALMLAFVKVGA